MPQGKHTEAQPKKWPLTGPRFKRLRNGGQSGKAVHDAVPPARTAMEVTLFVEESEGHTTVAAS